MDFKIKTATTSLSCDRNILLVQLPTSQYTAEKVYPIGLAKLSSLIPNSLEKSCLDMNLFADPWPNLHQFIQEKKPDIIAFSFRNMDPLAQIHSSYMPVLSTAVRLARKMAPHCRILCGGTGFSLFHQQLMAQLPEIDYGIAGEGEAGFPLLLEKRVKEEKVPGLVYRKNGEIHTNKVFRADLNCLPDIDTEMFNPKLYQQGNAYVAAMGIEAKRGCELACGYCTYPRLGGGKSRLRDPVLVVNDMETAKENGCSLLHFTDSVVNRPANHLEAICKEILRRELKIQWTGFFREDTLTDKLVDLAEKSGLVTIYFSGDALTDYGLQLLNKQLSKEDLFNAAKITARAGILTCCHFLINLPGETPQHFMEAKKSLETLLAIHQPANNLGAMILNNIRLYPDSALTRNIIESGELDTETNLLYPTYYNPQNSSHQLHELTGICHQAGVFDRLKGVRQ